MHTQNVHMHTRNQMTTHTPLRHPPDTHQTPARHHPDTLQTISIHPPYTHKTVTKVQTCRVIASAKSKVGVIPSFFFILPWEHKVNSYSNQLKLSWVCKL